MHTVEVVISPAAERELRKLNSDSFRTVAKAIDQLEREARPRGVEKIQGHPGFYRIRAGDFRVIFYPMSDMRTVVLLIGDRKNAYKNVKVLEKRLRAISN